MELQSTTSFFPTINPYFPRLPLLPSYTATPHLTMAQEIPLVPGAGLSFNTLSHPAAMAGMCSPFLVGCNKMSAPPPTLGALYSPIYPGLLPRPITLPCFPTNQGLSGNILPMLPRLDQVPARANPETIVNVCPSSTIPFLGSKQPLCAPSTALVKSLAQSMRSWLPETDSEHSKCDSSVSHCSSPKPQDVSSSESPSTRANSTKHISGSVCNHSTTPFRFHKEVHINKHPSASLQEPGDQSELEGRMSGRSGVKMNGNHTCLSKDTLANGSYSSAIQKNNKDSCEEYLQERVEKLERLCDTSQHLQKSLLDGGYSRAKRNKAQNGHVKRVPVLTNGTSYYPESQATPPHKQRIRSIPPLIKIHEYANVDSEGKDGPLQVAYSTHLVPGVNVTNLS